VQQSILPRFCEGLCRNDSRSSGAGKNESLFLDVAAKEETERGGVDLNLQLDLVVREISHLSISENYHEEE
jgi:hypothetical protein